MWVPLRHVWHTRQTSTCSIELTFAVQKVRGLISKYSYNKKWNGKKIYFVSWQPSWGSRGAAKSYTLDAHVIVTEAWKSEIRFRWLIRASVCAFFLVMVVKRVLVAETCITTIHSHTPPPSRPPLSHNLSRPLAGLEVPHEM